MITSNMAFLSSLQTRQILFYLTVVCNLAACSSNTASKMDDETNLVSGCRYTYPSYINPYTPLSKIDLISCHNMLTGELPFYENVTTMELVNVPLTVLNNTEIPNAICSPKVDLRQLSWRKSHIRIVQNIPMEELVQLDLSWNLIEEIHTSAFTKLTHLTLLNVSHNNLESLPDNLFARHNVLRSLSLAHNRLRSVPRDISNSLFLLEVFDASNNQLRHLKESTFHRNHHLQNLNLAHNQFYMLPANAFESLVALKYLSLEANQLFNIEPGTFDHQHHLMVLNLGNNPLRTLPIPLLPANNTLFVLTLSHTQLTHLKVATLQNLSQLRNLYLHDNRLLQNLPNDTFTNMHLLKVIYLGNNNFTQLPYSILDTEPEDLLLDGNPWPCDCSVQWIAFWAYNALGKGAGTFQDTVRMGGTCNATKNDLIEVLRKLRCKPTVLRISPIHYELLEANVKLICRSYANPRPNISWLTPNGLIYIETMLNDASSSNSQNNETTPPRILHSVLAKQRHLPVGTDNVADNENHKLYLYENGDLHIRQMGRDDAGEYMCLASNIMGESFAYTRLFVDPSIMQRIKTGSIICGFLWVNTFLLFSIVYLLIRRYSRRAKQEKQKRRMHENMDIYKSQQISRLRERCKNQMNRIKNNCSIQVEWMKDNYIESMNNNSQDHHGSYLTNQYNEQLTEIRNYYLAQMHKVCEHFNQQCKLITEFNVNGMSASNEQPPFKADNHCPQQPNDVIVHMENGMTSTMTAATINEDDLYRYNESLKSEIRRLTSLRNLHDAFVITAKCETKSGAAIAPPVANAPANSACCSGSSNAINKEAPVAASNVTSSGRYNSYADNNISNGKLSRTSEDEGDESTSMLHKVKIAR